MVSELLLSDLTKSRETQKAACSVCQKELHRMCCFELVCRSQGLDGAFVTNLPKGNSDSSFLVKQFFNVTLVPCSPFKGFAGRVIKY